MSTVEHTDTAGPAHAKRPPVRRPGAGSKAAASPVDARSGRMLMLQGHAGNAAVAGLMASPVDQDEARTDRGPQRRGGVGASGPPTPPNEQDTNATGWSRNGVPGARPPMAEAAAMHGESARGIDGHRSTGLVSRQPGAVAPADAVAPTPAIGGPVVLYFLVDRNTRQTDVVLHAPTTLYSVGRFIYGSHAGAEAFVALNKGTVADTLSAGARLRAAPLPGFKATPAALKAFNNSPWFAMTTVDPAARMAAMGIPHPSQYAARMKMLDAAFEADVARVVKKLNEDHYSDDDEEVVLAILRRWRDELLTKEPDRFPNGLYLDKFFSALKQRSRKIGIISEEITSYYDLLFNHFDAKAELRAIRDRTGHKGDDGTPEMSVAGFIWEDVASGAMRDRIFAYGKGVAKGAWSGVKGTVEFAYTAVTDPEKAWEQLKNMPGAMKKLWKNRGELWRAFVNASPEEQAEMIGRLIGEIEAGLATGGATKVAAGAAGGWLAKMAEKGGKLGRAAEIMLRASGAVSGIVGRIGAVVGGIKRFFSTALKAVVRPLLNSAKSLAGRLANLPVRIAKRLAQWRKRRARGTGSGERKQLGSGDSGAGGGRRASGELDDAAGAGARKTGRGADAEVETGRHGDDAAGGGGASKAADEVAPGPGDALTDDILVSHYGVPQAKATKLKQFADEHNVNIYARPTTPHAPKRLAEGAVPKIESVKAKTLSELDLELGPFGEADLGKVAYFKPELPPRPKGMPDAEWERITDRYVQRLEEFHRHADEMAYLAKDPMTRGPKPKADMREPGNDRIAIDNGIVKVVDETGAAKVMTGDIDIYQVTKADGSPFKDIPTGDGKFTNEYDDLMERMVEADLIEHGEHLGWKTRNAKEAGAKQGIMEKHEAGEHLVEFGPGGKATLTKASDVPGHTKALRRLQAEAPLRAKGLTFDKLKASSGVPGKDPYTVAGHSLTKHGRDARPGNALFPPVRGNPAQVNSLAARQVDEILDSGPRVVMGHRPRFGDTVEVIAPDGRAIVFDSSGKFLFFAEFP